MILSDIIGYIPARSGSKGVPDKNVRLLCNIPLIAYSISAALKSDLIERVIVSTDSKEYAQIARDYGAEVPFLRPKAISGDSAMDIEHFEHTINWFQQNEGYVPKYFAHLRPTTPLRDPKVINDALKLFIKSDYSALRSCHKMVESSYKTFEIENGKLKCFLDGGFDIESANLGRETFPITYDANGYIDVIRSELVQLNGQMHGNNVKAYITDRAYEIDELSDVDNLEYQIEKESRHMTILFDRE